MNDELDLLRQTVNRFAEQHGGASVLRQRRAASADDSSLFQACIEQGFHGVALAEDRGGAGLGWPGLALLMRAGGRALIDFPVLSGVQLAAECLQVCPDGPRQAALLAALAAGEQRVAVAWQSPLPHPDPYAPAVSLTERGEGWVLNGESSHVLGLIGADQVLVSAQGDTGLTLVGVSIDRPGLTVVPQQLIDHRNMGRLTLQDVAVIKTDLLCVAPRTSALLDALLDAGRLGLAAQMMGGAQAAYDLTLDYLKTRQQFGVPIGSFQALQHRIANVFIRLQLAEAALRQGVDAFAQGGRVRARGAALAKAQCGDAYALAASEGVQMHGGIGVTDEHDMGFHLKAAQVGNMLFGHADAMRSHWASLADY